MPHQAAGSLEGLPPGAAVPESQDLLNILYATAMNPMAGAMGSLMQPGYVSEAAFRDHGAPTTFGYPSPEIYGAAAPGAPPGYFATPPTSSHVQGYAIPDMAGRHLAPAQKTAAALPVGEAEQGLAGEPDSVLVQPTDPAYKRGLYQSDEAILGTVAFA